MGITSLAAGSSCVFWGSGDGSSIEVLSDACEGAAEANLPAGDFLDFTVLEEG